MKGCPAQRIEAGGLLKSGEELHGPMVLSSSAAMYMSWLPGDVSVVMPLFRQHCDQPSTQSSPQPGGRVMVPV